MAGSAGDVPGRIPSGPFRVTAPSHALRALAQGLGHSSGLASIPLHAHMDPSRRGSHARLGTVVTMAWPLVRPRSASRRLVTLALATVLGVGTACSDPQTPGASSTAGDGQGGRTEGTAGPDGSTLAEPPLDGRAYDGTLDGAAVALPDQEGRPNPDPESVAGGAGDATITVKPRDGARDYPNTAGPPPVNGRWGSCRSGSDPRRPRRSLSTRGRHRSGSCR